MASVYHLLCDAFDITVQIIEKERNNEAERRQNHYAALLIQRVWRGYLARREIALWHAAATVLQKYIRRFLVRLHMPQYLLDHIEYVRMKYYNQKAAKIQALWRGYWFRKYKCNLVAEFAMRKRIAKVNSELRALMEAERLRAIEDELQRIEDESKGMVLFILFKLHHHLRTTNIEGIYSLHNSSEYSWIENLIKSLKFTDYMKILKKVYKEKYERKPQTRDFILKGKWRNCEEAYYLRDKSQDVTEKLPEKENTFVQSKPFCLNPRIEHKYEKQILSQDPFALAIKHIERTVNPSGNISKTDFDLTMKMIEQKLKEPPYYIDFWSRICNIHNLDE